VDATLICAAPPDPESEGLEDADFGFEEESAESLPQAAIVRSAVASSVAWTMRVPIMISPVWPVVRSTVTASFTVPQVVTDDHPAYPK
jgi:hypothetical protein